MRTFHRTEGSSDFNNRSMIWPAIRTTYGGAGQWVHTSTERRYLRVERRPALINPIEVVGWSQVAVAAERLVISEATVKTHVASILHKHHMRDRAQAVVLAYESGLI